MQLRQRIAEWLLRKELPRGLSGVDSRGTWFPLGIETFPGAFQQAVEVDQVAVLAFSTVYACIARITGDIGKLRLKLVEYDPGSGIWSEISNPAFSPVLRRPNRYQTRQKFVEQWIASKLIHGNAYVLKERDLRGVVSALYVLDPQRVRTLVAPDGAVYYALNEDHLAGVQSDVPAIPASEVIHDPMVSLFHRLVGVSPLYACGLAATQGLKISNNSATFFDNMSRPSGILTAPAEISDQLAARLKANWENNYKSGNVGKVAVLGDGLKYEPMSVTAVDADLVKQLQLSAEQVCSAFSVPGWMVGVGPLPTYSNADTLFQVYHVQCLQALIKALQTSLGEGIGLDAVPGRTYSVHVDLDELLLMDMATQIKSLADQIGAGVLAPNEARQKLNLRPVDGGESPYMQQQNYSLAALAKRDAQNDPFAAQAAPAPAAPAAAAAEDEDDDEEDAEKLASMIVERIKGLPAWAR